MISLPLSNWLVKRGSTIKHSTHVSHLISLPLSNWLTLIWVCRRWPTWPFVLEMHRWPWQLWHTVTRVKYFIFHWLQNHVLPLSLLSNHVHGIYSSPTRRHQRGLCAAVRHLQHLTRHPIDWHWNLHLLPIRCLHSQQLSWHAAVRDSYMKRLLLWCDSYHGTHSHAAWQWGHWLLYLYHFVRNGHWYHLLLRQ